MRGKKLKAIIVLLLMICFSLAFQVHPQTRSMLQTYNPFPSISSLTGLMEENKDGSFDIYFGPTAPKGKENNWIQTVPEKGWFPIIRLYGPLEPWFDKTWKPGDFEIVEQYENK